jgi:hypothetical protein
MRTVATKVDNALHEKVVSRCNSLGCNPSEYIRNLIKSDLRDNNEWDENNNKTHTASQTISNHISKEIYQKNIANSALDISDNTSNGNSYSHYRPLSASQVKLVRSYLKDGEKFYVDSDGKRYIVKAHGNLIPISKVSNLKLI